MQRIAFAKSGEHEGQGKGGGTLPFPPIPLVR
jgi:hypothetical protein